MNHGQTLTIYLLLLLQLTEDGQTLELGLCALQHVWEEIKQEVDLAAILLQRLVELSALELLRHPRNAIQIHAQVGPHISLTYSNIFDMTNKIVSN